MAAAAATLGKGRCSICRGFDSDPAPTPCAHRFCRPCFTACALGSQADPLCPQCGVPCPQLAEPRPSRQLPGGHGLCREHDERLKLFCEEEEQLICVVCRESREHEGHRVRPLQEAHAAYKAKLQDWLPPLMEETDRLMKSKLAEEDAAKDLIKHLVAEKMKTVAEFRRMHKLLEEREQEILQRLEEMGKKINLTEADNVAKLSNEIISLNGLIGAIEAKSKGPAEALLKDIRATLSRCENVKFGKSCSMKGILANLKMPTFGAGDSEATDSKIQYPTFGAGNSEATDNKFQIPTFGAGNSEATDSKFQIPTFGAGNSEATDSKFQIPTFGAGNSEATDSKFQIPTFDAVLATDGKIRNPTFGAVLGTDGKIRNPPFGAVLATDGKIRNPTFGAVNTAAMESKFQIPTSGPFKVADSKFELSSAFGAGNLAAMDSKFQNLPFFTFNTKAMKDTINLPAYVSTQKIPASAKKKIRK